MKNPIKIMENPIKIMKTPITIIGNAIEIEKLTIMNNTNINDRNNKNP